MLRRTCRRLTSITETCVPANFVHATDMAFYFPRFQPRAHLQTHGIPELQDALALLQPSTTVSEQRWKKPQNMSEEEWKKSRDKALMLLSRGEEIMENVGGVNNPSTSDILRPLYAIKFELLNGVEHLPRSGYAHHVNVYRLILKQAGRLLYFNNTWNKSDIQQIDTACVIIAHFARAFCALNQRPFHIKKGNENKVKSNKSSPWSMKIDGSGNDNDVLTLSLVMKRIDELLQICRNIAVKQDMVGTDFRWYVPKLLLLKGILTIPLTGNLEHAREHIDESAKIVYEFLRRKQPILDGLVPRKQEPELGLFMLAQAEIAARVFDWSVGVNEVDKDVLEKFEAAAKFYSAPYNTTLDADGIMSTEHLDDKKFEVDAYSSCMLSYGTFLLNAPRPPGVSSRDSPVFLPKQIFSMSPITTVKTSSDLIFADVHQLVPMTIDVSRKRTGESFERALQLNRALYPYHKQNPKAGWILLAMASLYADMRDYLYATGLFASAEKTLVENYGNISLEKLFALKLRYEFLAGVGSDQEAKATGHEVVELLKQIDSISRE
ncbi:hypothetical protein LSM04_008926 [Trypanosoma melophagium]|uniref:uncharacterized protein n=1 Tax=Trypanosoma melophagium TaxID=715481 RepID=UPI00351A9698|nr:hypothetical protein LSM04_008926 [Trypanosoma melophagium]